MKRLAVLLSLSIVIAGCQKTAEPAPAPEPTAQPTAATPAPQGGNNTTIQQYTPTNLGGITPVQGAESIDGGGSAAGSVLKDRARHLPGASEGAPPTVPTDAGEPSGQ